MVPNERREKILSILQTREYISIHELAKRLYVSLPTIRRDLTTMEADGQVRRTHGGVTYIHPESDISPLPCVITNISKKKKRLARKLSNYYPMVNLYLLIPVVQHIAL